MRKLAIAFALLMISCRVQASSPSFGEGHVRPVLRLEKAKYLLGESIRFWVGVEPAHGREIAKEYQKPCSLFITQPNGNINIQPIGWPMDGAKSSGWYGGSDLGNLKVEVGSYTLMLECSGVKSSPVQLLVEKNEILNQVKAEFRFDRSGAVRAGESVPVVLSVKNNSPYTIQFPERGAAMEGVSVHITRKDPADDIALFYPWEKLSSSKISPDTYTWSVSSQVPSITLKTGEHFEQQFELEDAYRLEQPGEYEVEFSTVLSLLVGNQKEAFSETCPIRLPVVAREEFIVSVK